MPPIVHRVAVALRGLLFVGLCLTSSAPAQQQPAGSAGGATELAQLYQQGMAEFAAGDFVPDLFEAARDGIAFSLGEHADLRQHFGVRD